MIKWTRFNLEHKDYKTIYIDLDTTAPTPPHSDEHCAHVRTFLATRLSPHSEQRTPCKTRPPSSSASQVAPIMLPPRSSLTQSSLVATNRRARAAHELAAPWDTATPATNLMRLRSCRWTRTQARTCAPASTRTTDSIDPTDLTDSNANASRAHKRRSRHGLGHDTHTPQPHHDVVYSNIGIPLLGFTAGFEIFLRFRCLVIFFIRFLQ